MARIALCRRLVCTALRLHATAALSTVDDALPDVFARHPMAEVVAPRLARALSSPPQQGPQQSLRQAPQRAGLTGLLLTPTGVYPVHSHGHTAGDGDGNPLRTPAPPLGPASPPTFSPAPQIPPIPPMRPAPSGLTPFALALGHPLQPAVVNPGVLSRIAGRVLRAVELMRPGWAEEVAALAFDLSLAIGAGRVDEAGTSALRDAGEDTGEDAGDLGSTGEMPTVKRPQVNGPDEAGGEQEAGAA